MNVARIDVEKTEAEQQREDELHRMRMKYRKLTGKPVTPAMDSKIREYVQRKAG